MSSYNDEPRPVRRTSSAGGTPVRRTSSSGDTPVRRTTSASGTPMRRTSSASGTPMRRTSSASGTPVHRTTSTGGTPVRRTAPASRSGSSAGSVRRPSAAKTQRPGSSAAKTKKKNLTFLTVIAGVFASLWLLIKTIFSVFPFISKKFDRFRKNETTTIITNALLGAALILLVLGIIALCFPSLRAGYGRMIAKSGNYEQALAIANELEQKDEAVDKADKLRRITAEEAIKGGMYDTALNALADVPANDEQAARLISKARLGKANALFDAGSYAEAAELYDMLPDSMGAGGYSDCLCCMAVEAYYRNDEGEMHQLLLSANDAENRIRAAIIKVTGSSAEADKLIGGGIFNAETIARLKTNMQAVLDAQKNLPTGRIAVGDEHTVGLRANGTVIATGDNSKGQCNVSGWTNVKMVAAGAYHTVALNSNGTVTGVGDNSQGQLNVGAWRDIVMIACSQYDTIGLKSDGTVVSCGMHSYDLAGWHDVTSVCGGSYSAGCLYNQGSMHSTHKSAQLSAGKLLSSLSVSGAYSAGVMFDGSLCSSFDGAPAWTGLVRVTAGSTGIFAITNQGAVKSFFFRPSDSVNMQISGKALEIASSGTHHVILTSEGRVYAFGDNSKGQCSTGSWNLN